MRVAKREASSLVSNLCTAAPHADEVPCDAAHDVAESAGREVRPQRSSPEVRTGTADPIRLPLPNSLSEKGDRHLATSAFPPDSCPATEPVPVFRQAAKGERHASPSGDGSKGATFVAV